MAASKTKDNWAFLGFIRFLLAFVVVATHLVDISINEMGVTKAIDLFGGKAAVLGFFLISGYSIAASLRRGPEGFIYRRFLRIYPMYFGAFLLTLCVQHYFSGGTSVNGEYYKGDSWLVILGNFFLTQMFLCKALVYNGPFWSLSIEFSYYLLAPFLLLVPKRYMLGIMLLSGLVFLLRKDSDGNFLYSILVKFNFLKYIWCWLIGFYLFGTTSRVLKYGGLLISLLLLYFSPVYTHWLNLVTVSVAYLAILFSGNVSLPSKVNSILMYLGDISYPIYLIHFPLFILFIGGFSLDNDLFMYFVVIVTACSFVFLFDGLVKKYVFKPIFIKIFQSRLTNWVSSFLSISCMRSYRV